MELTEFLLARIADDEAAARDALNAPTTPPGSVIWQQAHLPHIARWQPLRVLAECEAKRRIVAEHEMSPFPTLALLALPHADHADYDERWRP